MTDGPHDAIGGIFELFQICTKQCFLSSLCAMGVHCSSVLDVRVEEETESGQESVLLLRELARRETCLLLRSKQFSGIVTLVPAGDAMQAVVLRATSRLENSFLSRVVAATSTCRPWEDYFHRSSGGTFGKQLQSLPVVPDVWARVVEEERARAGIEPPPFTNRMLKGRWILQPFNLCRTCLRCVKRRGRLFLTGARFPSRISHRMRGIRIKKMLGRHC